MNFEKEGYYVIKLIQTNKNGISDLLLLPLLGSGNVVRFVESKRLGKQMEPLQVWRAKEIEEATGIKTIKLDK